MRCGSCNEVFDGNAALLEPPAALPASLPLDQKLAALDTRAAEVLGAEEAPPTLQLDLADGVGAADAPPLAAGEDAALDIDMDDEPIAAAPPAPIPLPAEPAILPANTDALFDLDLDIESEPDLEANSEPDVNAAPLEQILSTEELSEDELEAALEAELSAMELTLADVQHDADGLPGGEDAYADMNGGRIEPTWDDSPLDDEPQAGAGPGLNSALAAAADAVAAAEAEDAPPSIAATASSAAAPDAAAAADLTANPVAAIDADLAAFLAEPSASGEDDDLPADRSAATAAADAPPPPSRPLRDDELDEVDEEALVQLSSSGLAEAQAARAHAYLHAHGMDDLAPANEEQAAPEEPGFVRRDRQRQKFGKAATVVMSLGSVLLVAALLAQAVTTFRNSIAATVPALKPALAAACQTLGCKIELPTQIDDLTIEQGELQTLSDTTFSFTTLLRNQSTTAQAWPSIELVLDDDKDKRILRRVFTPRDYLPTDVAMDKGFAPHTEQAVKLYFELHDLKASGYHIAVFYP
ncbi:DUF3426 domain-containing protein [Duganella radicis]|uniref:DUF3426 domain-containing protein n=1 Tax=Duganella radicis TaxID=551988 RepID=UPI003FCE264D